MTSIVKNPLLYIVLSLACTAQLAKAQTWSGGAVPLGNLNWSNGTNWVGGVPPASGGAVVFNDGGFPLSTNGQGKPNNIVSGNTSISSLTFNNQDANFETTVVSNGNTLTISGGLSVGASDAANSNTVVTITGGGSLVVASAGSATLSGQNGSGQGTVSTLDLSGLTNFTFGVAGSTSSTLSLGTGGSGSSITMNLPPTNNITAGTLNIGVNNTRGTDILNLGNSTNNIFADTIDMGYSKAVGTMQFLNNKGGGLKIANHTGTGRSTLNISGENNSGGTSANNNGSLLFNGGTVNILAGTMTLGNRTTRTGGGTATGVLSYNSGIVDATTINMALNSGGDAANGTISVGGATLIIGSGGMSMVNQTGTAGAGTLIVTNGSTVICSNNIYKTTSIGTATISISSSTLTMTSDSGTIGVNSGSTVPIDNFNATNSTFTLPAIGAGQPDVATVNFNPDTVTTNTINISALPVINSYPVQFPIISYTTAGGNLANETTGMTNIVLGTLPSPFMGYLSNNLAGLSIDLVLTNGPLPKADTWTGAINNLWDITTFNWTSGGIATNFDNLDSVTFDDTSVTNVVNITGTRIPSASNGLTFNNSVTNYTLTGVGKISGQVQLQKEGSATTTLSESGGDNFSGGISVSGGMLILDDPNSAISGGLTISGGTTLQIGNNDSNGTLPSGTLDDEGTLVYDHNNSVTVSVSIPGGGALAQNGSGTLTLSAANAYTGTTLVNAGTLALSGSGAISSSSGVNVSNATLDVSGVTGNAGVTTLAALNMTNANLNVKVGYIQTNLNITGALNLGGTTNVINVKSLPAITYYPATLVLLTTGTGISGFNTLGLGTMPSNSPAYVGSISEVGNTVVLTLSSGPTNSRPSVTWSGADALSTGITNWSDALNWETPGVPMATEPVVFNDTDAAGGSPFSAIGDGVGGIQNAVEVNNYVDISLTNSALTYGNVASYQNTQIGSGHTLTINGSLTVNGGDGFVTILGAGGTLQMADPNNNNTLDVENATVPTLDMSGLDTFVANVNQIAIGYDIASGASVTYGQWYLAKTNIITTGSGFSGTSSSWVIGGSSSQDGSGDAQVYLGQTNAIYVDGIVLGPGAESESIAGDTLAFNPNLTNPAVYIRGITGSSSRVTTWSLGDDTVNINNGPDTYGHVVDFSIGTVDAMVSTLIIGQGAQGNEVLTAGDIVGTFNMGAGNLNVLNLEIGASDNGKTGGGGTGIMNVNGGTVVAGSLGLGLGNVPATAGTLNLSNATLVVSNGITIGTGTSGGTLSLSNSTVELLGGTIGATAAPLSTLNFAGATLQMNLNGFSGADVVSTNVTANGLATIEIGSITNAFKGLTYPLISYAGSASDPFNSFSLAPLPVGYTGVLVDNASTGVIGLQLTSGPALVQPLITAFAINGSTLTISATNGLSGQPYTLYGTTNLSPPVVWTPIFTNNFNTSGAINNLSTNVVNPAVPNQFYLLQEP